MREHLGRIIVKRLNNADSLYLYEPERNGRLSFANPCREACHVGMWICDVYVNALCNLCDVACAAWRHVLCRVNYVAC